MWITFAPALAVCTPAKPTCIPTHLSSALDKSSDDLLQTRRQEPNSDNNLPRIPTTPVDLECSPALAASLQFNEPKIK